MSMRYWVGTVIEGSELAYQTIKPVRSAAMLALVRWADQKFPGRALPVPLNDATMPRSAAEVDELYRSVFEINLDGLLVFPFVRLSDP